MNLGDEIRGGSNGGDKGRAFRRANGVLFASAGMKNTGSLGRVGGTGPNRSQFSTFQNELYHINLKLAVELQEMMLDRLESSRVPSRKGVASGRLQRALEDRKNRTATNFGFGVGNMAWLDESDAKYWRSIEVGTDQFVGNLLPIGLWGGVLTGDYGGNSAFGPYPLAGDPWTVTGANRSGRMRPMGRSFVYRALIEGGMKRRQAFQLSKRKQAVIEQPIEAHHYMKGAWSDFRPASRTSAAVRQALKASGITP